MGYLEHTTPLDFGLKGSEIHMPLDMTRPVDIEQFRQGGILSVAAARFEESAVGENNRDGFGDLGPLVEDRHGVVQPVKDVAVDGLRFDSEGLIAVLQDEAVGNAGEPCLTEKVLFVVYAADQSSIGSLGNLRGHPSVGVVNIAGPEGVWIGVQEFIIGRIEPTSEHQEGHCTVTYPDLKEIAAEPGKDMACGNIVPQGRFGPQPEVVKVGRDAHGGKY